MWHVVREVSRDFSRSSDIPPLNNVRTYLRKVLLQGNVIGPLIERPNSSSDILLSLEQDQIPHSVQLLLTKFNKLFWTNGILFTFLKKSIQSTNPLLTHSQELSEDTSAEVLQRNYEPCFISGVNNKMAFVGN
ncbi:hypothetical protein JRO89_XS02G0014900 [Xanthoceras sorbifolium]|uniref:Uncharacterized protein n=1 Tax=Xanthoceras sorbifolium TaxID=99658 RepID=A0ABQ8IED4_9ROSI|nr:hypothetical protein JRO89_XS02G0014900 [Xanthoceras sorbifolium]